MKGGASRRPGRSMAQGNQRPGQSKAQGSQGPGQSRPRAVKAQGSQGPGQSRAKAVKGQGSQRPGQWPTLVVVLLGAVAAAEAAEAGREIGRGRGGAGRLVRLRYPENGGCGGPG